MALGVYDNEEGQGSSLGRLPMAPGAQQRLQDIQGGQVPMRQTLSAPPGMAPQGPAPQPMMQSASNPGSAYPLAGPNLLAPWTTGFQAPLANDVYKLSPGYEFRLGEGLKGVERSAAARGTLLGGRTGKELTRYAQDYASSEYDKIYNRALGEYGMANQIYNQNGNNAYSRLFNLAQLGQGAAAQSASLGQGYGQMAGNLMTDIGNVNAAGQIGSGNAWGGFIGNAANQIAVNQALNRPSPYSFTPPSYPPQQAPQQPPMPAPQQQPTLAQPYDPSQDYFGQQQGF